MGQLVKQETALQTFDKEGVTSIAIDMIKAKLLPTGMTVESALTIAIKGHELGIPPMQALSEIYVVQGKAELKAELKLQLAAKRIPGFQWDILEMSDKQCVVEYRRPGRAPFKYTFTKEMVAKAGVGNSTLHTKYPDLGLFYRNVSNALRVFAPDYKEVNFQVVLPDMQAANEAISDLCEDNGNIVDRSTGEVVGKFDQDPVVEAEVVEPTREPEPHEMEGYEEAAQTEAAPSLFGNDAPAEEYKCSHSGCGKVITKTVWQYSLKTYKMALCVDHQKLHEKVG